MLRQNPRQQRPALKESSFQPSGVKGKRGDKVCRLKIRSHFFVFVFILASIWCKKKLGQLWWHIPKPVEYVEEVEAGGSWERNWIRHERPRFPVPLYQELLVTLSKPFTFEALRSLHGDRAVCFSIQFAWLQGGSALTLFWTTARLRLQTAANKWSGKFYRNTTVGDFSETIICLSVCMSSRLSRNKIPHPNHPPPASTIMISISTTLELG